MGRIDNTPTLAQVMAWCQAMTWNNVDHDQWCDMIPFGHNELMVIPHPVQILWVNVIYQ